MAAKDIARGKALERFVGRLFGGDRRGHQTGGREFSDCRDTPIAFECKAHEGLQLRTSWIEQARRNAAREGKPWAVVQRPKGWRSPIVTIELEYLHELVMRRTEEGTNVDRTQDSP